MQFDENKSGQRTESMFYRLRNLTENLGIVDSQDLRFVKAVKIILNIEFLHKFVKSDLYLQF